MLLYFYQHVNKIVFFYIKMSIVSCVTLFVTGAPCGVHVVLYHLTHCPSSIDRHWLYTETIHKWHISLKLICIYSVSKIFWQPKYKAHSRWANALSVVHKWCLLAVGMPVHFMCWHYDKNDVYYISEWCWHVYWDVDLLHCEFGLLSNKMQDMIRNVNKHFMIFKTSQHVKSFKIASPSLPKFATGTRKIVSVMDSFTIFQLCL